MTQLSEHFSLEELIRSDYAIRHGIDNFPDDEVLENLGVLATCLERVRGVLGVPIHVLSGYRCPRVNAAIGGARLSQHTLGQAADIVAPDFGPPLAVAQELVWHKAELNFDQLIFESGWLHVSFSQNPRGDILTAHFTGGLPPTYTKGLA